MKWYVVAQYTSDGRVSVVIKAEDKLDEKCRAGIARGRKIGLSKMFISQDVGKDVILYEFNNRPAAIMYAQELIKKEGKK